jgi:hypothetical protein
MEIGAIIPTDGRMKKTEVQRFQINEARASTDNRIHRLF